MFSVILPGRPCLTEMATMSPTQFAFSFPTAPTFSHIVVFLLPGTVLPPDTAAAVYMQSPGQANYKLLGAIANDKPSAVFKVDRVQAQDGMVSLGISVEAAADVQMQLAQQQQQQAQSPVLTVALARQPPSTKVLAQRIIGNAFNFLASFAGGAGGQEVVPLKSFQDWWVKFERRIENDPAFLERDEEG